MENRSLSRGVPYSKYTVYSQLLLYRVAVGMGIHFSLWEFPQKSCGNGNQNSLPMATLAQPISKYLLIESGLPWECEFPWGSPYESA